MKLFSLIFFIFFYSNFAFASNGLIFFLESAYKNNPKIKAERELLKASKENINISRSEFLPSISITGKIDSTQSTKRTDQNGSNLPDASTNTSSNTLSVDQKIFEGFGNVNSLKKAQLELKKANFNLKKIEQEIILESATAYFDLIYKTKKEQFNMQNLELFERQVESDKSRLQRGEISLTDLAQSESSLAGANANLISAKTELLTSKTNFEKVIRVSVPEELKNSNDFIIILPQNLDSALEISQKNNPKLKIAELNYEISKKDVKIERGELSPSASLNYSLSKSDDFSSTVDEVEKESVNATVTWPIIKGGQNYSSLKKAKFKKEQSNLLLQDTVNEVQTEITNSWSIFQSTESVLRSTEAQVIAAEIANEGITLEYESGNTRTTLEVIQSRSLLLNARITNAKAERDYMVAKFDLLDSIGNLTLNNIKKK